MLTRLQKDACRDFGAECFDTSDGQFAWELAHSFDPDSAELIALMSDIDIDLSIAGDVRAARLLVIAGYCDAVYTNERAQVDADRGAQ